MSSTELDRSVKLQSRRWGAHPQPGPVAEIPSAIADTRPDASASPMATFSAAPGLGPVAPRPLRRPPPTRGVARTVDTPGEQYRHERHPRPHRRPDHPASLPRHGGRPWRRRGAPLEGRRRLAGDDLRRVPGPGGPGRRRVARPRREPGRPGGADAAEHAGVPRARHRHPLPRRHPGEHLQLLLGRADRVPGRALRGRGGRGGGQRLPHPVQPGAGRAARPPLARGGAARRRGPRLHLRRPARPRTARPRRRGGPRQPRRPHRGPPGELARARRVAPARVAGARGVRS